MVEFVCAQENKAALLTLQIIPQPQQQRTEERAIARLHIIEAKPNRRRVFDEPLINPQ